MVSLFSDVCLSRRDAEDARIVAADMTADAVRQLQLRTWRRYPPGHPLHHDMNTHSAVVLGRHRESISKGRLFLFEGQAVMGTST